MPQSFTVIALALSTVLSVTARAKLPESEQIKHFYGVCWRGALQMNMRAARALGYKYILFGHVGRKHAARPEAKGLRFFLETPESLCRPLLPIKLGKSELKDLRKRWPRLFASYPRISQWFKDEWFDELKAYRPDVWRAYKEAYEQYFPWCSTMAEFPRNIAVGWVGSSLVGHPMPDFQQKAVVDFMVKTIVEHARESDNPDNDFHFVGCAWDVPSRWGEYWPMKHAPARKARQRPIPGGHSDPRASAVWHPGITHDYSTLREGILMYYLSLRKALQGEFPDRKIYYLYEPWTPRRWTTALRASSLSEADRRLIAGDALFSEGPSLEYLKDSELGQIVEAGWHSKNDLGSSTPNLENDYDKHLKYLGILAGVHGLWFNSFGRFDAQKTDIATRGRDLVVARLIPNWDNLNAVPMSERSWDAKAKVYRSPKSYADKDVLYSRQPVTGKVFVVFRSAEGKVHLHPDETVTDIRRTNELFEPVHDGRTELTIDGRTVEVRSSDSCGKCYVISVKRADTDRR